MSRHSGLKWVSFRSAATPFIGYSNQSTAQKADSEAVFKPLKNGGTLDFVAAWYVKAANYLRGEVTAITEQMPGAHTLRFLKSPPTSAPHSPLGVEVRHTIRVAFVSTNSITQGEQVATLWSWLFAQGIYIHFAHRTFRWSNEASGKAAVHCVIIGLGLEDLPGKVIYEYTDVNGEPHPVPVTQINPYLLRLS